MKLNSFLSEWTDNGAVVKVEGFPNIELHCPACDAILPRGIEHRCGDRLAPPIGKRKKASRARV